MPRKNTGQPTGRPRFKPTDEERKIVEMMAALGTPLADMARNVRKGGIDIKTLTKHFEEEIATGATKANVKVGGAMYNKAIGGDVQAQKYFLGCRAGWKETSVQEHSGDMTVMIKEFSAKPTPQ
jgi:hypothetical protein